MVDTLTVSVTGAQRLHDTLAAAGDGLARLQALHADVARLVAREGLALVPHRSGKLGDSIRSAGTEKAAFVRAGNPLVPYAGVQEFGWPKRNIPPSPYLTISLERNELAILVEYGKAVDKLLAEVKGA